MIGETFWKESVRSLAGKWLTQVLVPAFVFWGGGLLAYTYRYGWAGPAQWWTGLRPEEQVTALVELLLLVSSSAMLMRRLELDLLRLLEGYWPGPLRWLRFRLARRWERKLKALEDRWNYLALECKGKPENLPPAEYDEYILLDTERAHFPANTNRLMPTRLGNLLRAAEEHPQVHYGLTASVCWPHLWLLLPDVAREELAGARERLDGMVRLMAWGLLFCVWTVWAWWAAPAGLAVAFLACQGALRAAEAYGTLIRASFDLYRFSLYEQLHLPLPAPEEESTAGEKLTEALWR